MTVREGFSTPIAARLGRVSVDTLENWDRRGILKPSIVSKPTRGVPRVWSFRDIVAIRVLDELRRAGIEPRNLRKVVDYLRKRRGLSAAEVLASTILVTDGVDVYEVDGDVRISTLRNAGQAVLHLVPLGILVNELEAAAREVQAA